MVRTGNEDAFSVLYSAESRQDDVAECALLLLADGMGGYEAGEVAASMALATLRKNLTTLKPFAAMAGGTGFAHDLPQADGNPPRAVDVEEMKGFIKAALKDANTEVRRSAAQALAHIYGSGRFANPNPNPNPNPQPRPF